MARALILEFDGVGREQYQAVNEALGVDTNARTGDWPDGLRFHAGAVKAGGLVVFEVWESEEHQDRFMRERLGRALEEGGVSGPPARVEWLDLVGYTG